MQDNGEFTLEGLAQALSAEAATAHARAILVRVDDQWHLRHVWALLGARPPAWSVQAWEYERIAFVSALMTPKELRALCSSDEARTITVGNYVAALPLAQDMVRFQRKPSFSQHDRPMLPWPTFDFTVSTPNQSDRHLGVNGQVAVPAGGH